MKFLQLRINYSENTASFFQEFAAPLQHLLGVHYFRRWTLARGWKHGPHYLLTLDAGSLFFRPEWPRLMQRRAEDFLRRHPSAPLDVENYRKVQARLNQMEAAGIDPELVEANNTAGTTWAQLETLAAKYESAEQWLSVFDTECQLRKAVLAHWTGAEAAASERCAFELMILLACVYPPAPSDDPEVFEYNGFLSYHSNYLFWHHALTPAQQAGITQRFSTAYAEALPRYQRWLDELQAAVAQPGHRCSVLAQILLHAFLAHCSLAQDGVIHARSPFPREQLAERQQVSAFHQRHFYDGQGGARPFSLDFCGYRWLLNIVYRTLPLLNVSPMARQQLNYSLNRLQAEQAEAIRAIRRGMLTADLPQRAAA